MITITRFDVRPNPTSCGMSTDIEVRVEWAGPAPRKIEVCVDIPRPCTFDQQPRVCDTKTGVSPLNFRFDGKFDCPRGTTHHLLLDAEARDVAKGNEVDRSRTNVTVGC